MDKLTGDEVTNCRFERHSQIMGKLKRRLASAALALALAALCLQSVDLLNSRTQVLTQAEQKTRNHAASLLYAKLATLSQPYERSDITRTVHQFISNDPVIAGATVFDRHGQLVAQMGGGNDQLLEQPLGQSLARVPIKSGDVHVGHVLLSFQSTRSLTELVFHYVALASALVLLSMLFIWLISHGARALLSMLRQAVNFH